jgi:hypothetical protein
LDGKEMKPKIERGKGRFFWSTKLSPDLSLVRKFDKTVLLVTLLAIIPCAVAAYFMAVYGDYTLYDIVPVMTLPLFLDGILIYIHERRWKSSLAVLLLVLLFAVLHFTGHITLTLTILFFTLFILFGGTGVVALAEGFQRFMFYKVVHSIEYMNVKKKFNVFDKVISFIFNVPEDLDTRNITMNYNLERTSIPWKEMMQTITVALMLGMTIWIYISMNPNFMDSDTYGSLTSVSVFMFSLILMIPLLVLPFTIFKSLEVRIETNYRAFHIHSGAMETMKRMALPIGATLIYVFLAINKSDPLQVLTYIGVSALAIIFVVGYTCILYYTTNERTLVRDIAAKWKVFRPVPVFVRLDDENRGRNADEKLPGTPLRDLSDFGELDLP